MNQPPIFLSKRFRRAYQKASVPLQRLIEGATHGLVLRFRESRETVKRNYDRLEHLKPQLGLLEVDVSGANRMVADILEGDIHLLDVGGHETVPRYTFGKYLTDKHQKEAAHSGFWPETISEKLHFFTRNPCEHFANFGSEFSPEWLYFLSAQQSEILHETMDTIVTADPIAISPIFIVGGPGTGKTSILINLLKHSVELGLNARMRCSRRMKEFIIASTPGINPDLLLVSGDRQMEGIDLLIVDDPETTEVIQREIAGWISQNRRMAIAIGFDPCQIQGFDPKKRTSGLDDVTFDKLVEITKANVFGLDECYRQKENVGLATQKALRLLAESTPFLADQKIADFRNQHIGVSSLGHELSFPNPHGYVQVYTEWTNEEFNREIERIQRTPQWRHWPSTLVVVENANDVVTLRTDFQKGGLACDVIDLNDISQIQGLEYQHLILFITKDTFYDLESGRQGIGQAKYAEFRLLRIPLSRPKDSQVVFVLNEQ